MKNEITNIVHLQGSIVGKGTFSHETYGEKFYEYQLATTRNSGTIDVVPIIIGEKLLINPIKEGDIIALEGQYRSFNKIIDNGKIKLVLTVFVKRLIEVTEGSINTIKLTGYVCKEPIYRMTPLGREVSDLLLAVNRSYNKSDYIPCIAWGRNAKYSSNFKIGDIVELVGRIQSRTYEKKDASGEVETKIAYEVSVINLTKLNIDATSITVEE